MDRWKYAVNYCEKNGCERCYIRKNNLDTRTGYEIIIEHTPCCENIHDYMERNDLDELPAIEKIYVVHSTKYDFVNELYEPLKQSEINKDYTLIFPHKNSKELFDSKSLFCSGICKYVIAEVSEISIGAGIELGWADLNNVKIICVYKSGSKISSSLKAVCNLFIEYVDTIDMLSQLEMTLSNN